MMKRLFYITILAGFSLGACHSAEQEENQTTGGRFVVPAGEFHWQFTG